MRDCNVINVTIATDTPFARNTKNKLKERKSTQNKLISKGIINERTGIVLIKTTFVSLILGQNHTSFEKSSKSNEKVKIKKK